MILIDTDPSPEYEAARLAHNAASKAYRDACDAYRARRTTDAEFLAARRSFDTASDAYDAAFAKESQ
jgi:hypothetical protein